MSWSLLIALLIKSGVVAGAGLACERLLKWRAVERVDVLRATVCLLLALPVITAILPGIDLALLPPLAVEPPIPLAVVAPGSGAAPTTSWSWPPSGETIAAVWLFGMALVAGRLMLGLRTLTRWTRQGQPVTCPSWLAPIEDLSPEDRPKLVSSDRAAYARTLVRLAANPLPHRVPHRVRGLATAMAADSRTLKTRIACIMTDTSDRRRPLTLALTVVALAAVATPLAALGISRQVAPAAPALPPAPPAASQPVQPAQPAAPRAAHSEHHAFTKGGKHYVYTSYREATPEEAAAMEEAHARAEEARSHAEGARAMAEEARRAGEEARRAVEAHRGEIEAARRMAEDVRRQTMAQGDWAREAGERAREAGERAREAGERAREAGERARVEAAHHMVEARAQMAQGAVQMRQGAKQMREEADRLRDPAYRAKQIAENRARGNVVTDEELRALSESLPKSADKLDRSADKLAERAARRES